jgi:hypothetical protein
MAGLALLALLITCVPARGEEPSTVAADPMNPSTDPALISQPLAQSASDMDISMHADAPGTAEQSVMAPRAEFPRGDETLQPVTDSPHADVATTVAAESPQSDAEGAEHITEGSEADAHA